MDRSSRSTEMCVRLMTYLVVSFIGHNSFDSLSSLEIEFQAKRYQDDRDDGAIEGVTAQYSPVGLSGVLVIVTVNRDERDTVPYGVNVAKRNTLRNGPVLRLCKIASLTIPLKS